jgi:hypothetical protein
MSPNATATIAVACPCGGHTLALSPDKPPPGARAAFTCPACGQRRTFTRTESGAIFDGFEPAQTQPAAPTRQPAPPSAPSVAKAAPLPAPTPVPPGAALLMTALPDVLNAPESPYAPWFRAVAEAFPAPGWHVLPASPDARQVAADVRFHRPAVVLVADPASVGHDARAQALLAAVAALPGRVREALTVAVAGAFAEGDPLAAFRLGADVVLALKNTADAAARLQAAHGATVAKPSYFHAEQG